MKLAIVGSQSLSDHQAEHVWTLVEGIIVLWEPEEIWSGGATGVDSITEQVAKVYGYREDSPEGMHLVICRPDVQAWNPVGRRGFKARNQEIVNGVDRLVRISRHLGQITYGSGWTADRAEERLGAENVFRFYV